ncbi:MAG TPA: AGE family epimerase/isomerase [Opitutus sp.]|nr:AGE family epimerase/isomerase [Opitutus sp.]
MVLSVVLAGLVRAAPAGAAAVPPPAPADYARQVEAELRDNILPFWLHNTRDRERGGFYGLILGSGEVEKDAPRGALLTARVLWTFSAAYRRYHDPAYLEMARWAYDDLLARFWDKDQGGLYWRVGADGVPLDRRKIIYVQTFGIYGLAEFYRATGEKPALDRAIALYRLMENHAHDRGHGGYFEEFTRDWKRSRDRGPHGSAMGSLGQKSQNVHIHILEAYTNLLRAWPDAGLKQNERDLIDVLLTRIYNPVNHHLRLFLDEDWTPRSATWSFGHDIEFSWLLVEAAETLGDESLVAAARTLAGEIAHTTLAEGVDPDGGVLGEAGPEGLTETFKEWWPQAEAATGFLNAYQITHDERFLAQSEKTWEFIERHLVDHEQGGWYRGVSRDGRKVSTMKVSFWKCPYHNSRACMELLDRLQALGSKS